MVGRVFAFVGSLNRDAPYFQGARGKGIAVLSFDQESGRLTPQSERDGIDNPTFLAAHPANRCLYATSEVFGEFHFMFSTGQIRSQLRSFRGRSWRGT